MSLLRSYDAFLFANASQITAVESSLRSLAFFLPGRFKDAEL
jgi:peroxin-16